MKYTKRKWMMLMTLVVAVACASMWNPMMTVKASTLEKEEVAERVDLELSHEAMTTSENSRAVNNDYRTWDQADSRWGSIKLGSSSYTMERSGCLVTSVTKLIVQSGLKTSSFTPKTLVTWMNNNGGFTSSGAFYWAKPSEYIPKFSYVGNLLNDGTYTSKNYNSKFTSWIKDGYHLVVQVKNRGHWVAIDEKKTLETGTIYIMDSLPYNENADITLQSRYSTFNRVVAYKGGKTPEVLDKEPVLTVKDASELETKADLQLNWTKVQDYTAGYWIERKCMSDEKPAWEKVAEITDGNTLQWIDQEVKPEEEYVYRVQPYNKKNVGGPYSNQVTFKTKHIHVYTKFVAKKATTSSSGKIQNDCDECETSKYTTIARIESVTLSATSYAYNGKTKKPSVTVKNSAGKEISSQYYDVTYDSGRKNVGTYNVKVVFKERYSGTVIKTFKIIPQKPTLKNISNSGTKKINVKWEKLTAQVSGYEIKWSTTKKFTSNYKSQTAGASKSSAKIKVAQSNRTYYVKVRSYKTVNGVKYYSNWSATKQLKTK